MVNARRFSTEEMQQAAEAQEQLKARETILKEIGAEQDKLGRKYNIGAARPLGQVEALRQASE